MGLIDSNRISCRVFLGSTFLHMFLTYSGEKDMIGVSYVGGVAIGAVMLWALWKPIKALHDWIP